MRLVPGWIALATVACHAPEPRWEPVPPLALAPGASETIDLAPYVDDADGVSFTAQADAGVTTAVVGSRLTVTAALDFSGTTEVALTAARRDNGAQTTLVVTVDPALTPPCPTTLRYTARAGATAVTLAGDFNGWDAAALPLTPDGDDWTVTVDLPPGAYAYKFVERVGGTDLWSCDPANGAFQCDAGYTWDPSCPPGGGGCNSVLEVPDCRQPALTVADVTIDRGADALQVRVDATGDLRDPWATLDGVALAAWTGDGFTVDVSDLGDGRHTLRFGGTDAAGRPVQEAYVPAWTDDADWQSGLMYFAFVDRFADGDPSRNTAEGATAALGDYLGGDWQGVIDHLDDLDDLGVTALWLTAPVDNPEGAFDGDCGQTYTGYHGYWPVSGTALEGHFGDADTLQRLVDEAHRRGMRVLVDWVANHVHEDHPWVTERPDWFTDRHICREDDDGDGVVNWDQRPETCWFASYLPDFDYYRLDTTLAVVDEAVDLAVVYGFDGFRVDAVKHLPHSVHATLAARVAARIEHPTAGGDEPFYTVGETFTGDRGLIASYVRPGELDGQFDFPLYWTVLGAFARDEVGLSNGPGSLADAVVQSQAAYGEGQMSIFLGNHDVARFIAHANGEVGSLYGDGACNADGSPRASDTPPTGADPYDRLRLAWAFLLTQPGLPLVYYGDEIGLPGYGDPDNRQSMRWEPDRSDLERSVHDTVAALGQARRAHPAFRQGATVGWWENEPDVWAYARVHDGDAVLVALNRSTSPRVLANGLSFAGLPTGTWEDVLTGERLVSSGDALTVEVPARGARVLVPAP
jgi:glycosidase